MSIEENVEYFCKTKLDELSIRHYGKTEEINQNITDALKNAMSKSGGNGINFPDIKLLLDNGFGRFVPVMIEAKGTADKLEKLAKDGQIEIVSNGKNPYSAVQNYAVNGALHYGNAILDGGVYDEVIIIGINGSMLAEGIVADYQQKAYYVTLKNNRLPKHILELDKDFSLLASTNTDKLFNILDKLNLTVEETEMITRQAEQTLEEKIKNIHQRLYDDPQVKTLLTTNQKLYMFCGLIMAGLKTPGLYPLEVSELHSNDDEMINDGTIVTSRISSFLKKKNCSEDKIKMIEGLLIPVFQTKGLWKPINGNSVLKEVYKQIKNEVIPCLESNLHLDFTGKILNSLSDWVSIENNSKNDVVLTPRYVTTLMAKMARTDMDSFVWDRAMGSAGFLVSAMDIMIKDAQNKIHDEEKLRMKIKHIKENQLLGVEILGNIYILAVLNMILMGDGSSHIICGDGHIYDENTGGNFPATVFLLNPPYSHKGKGFCFVDEALSKMTTGYACILIQENAGSGQGGGYTKRILEKNSLIASIHMPAQLFGGKASVQAAIYVFKVNEPHNPKAAVKFIDFSVDGYSRQNRKKSTQEVNLRNTDHAIERYKEIEDIVLGNIPDTNYYTKENGLLIEDRISLSGNDWTYAQHKKIDTMLTEEDLKKTVADYLAWKVSTILRGE